ncbi:MAG: precorrin-6y C5,15-methyltransferase (decarboxylating) subunit CbiE [Actinomycetia bacterium]|nr:precorrin-6y C5,15-methyltransferase (decarboxylating) subunit CbiE [Actinomycetes bacterium]
MSGVERPGPLWVVGCGADGPESLGARARAAVEAAEVLYGGRRLLELFEPRPGQERVVVDRRLDAFVRHVAAHRAAHRVVLASGDPNFFGIAEVLYRAGFRDEMTVEPNVSSVQWLFARIRLSWHDAYFASCHGRPADAVVELVREHPKVAVLTDPANHPGALAARLTAAGFGDVRVYVGERLGTTSERVTEHPAREVPAGPWDPLAVVAVVRDPGPAGPPRLGLPDAAIQRLPGQPNLFTKGEVRAVSLWRLALRPGDVVWDIGTGTGAVALEAAGLVAPGGRVFAVDGRPEAVATVQANAARFGRRVTAVQGWAPEEVDARLEDPDAVFVGGSNGRLAAIMAWAARRLRPGGRLAANVVGLEHLEAAVRTLEAAGWTPEVTQVAVARGVRTAGLMRLVADNPVFVVAARHDA